MGLCQNTYQLLSYSNLGTDYTDYADYLNLIREIRVIRA